RDWARLLRHPRFRSRPGRTRQHRPRGRGAYVAHSRQARNRDPLSVEPARHEFSGSRRSVADAGHHRHLLHAARPRPLRRGRLALSHPAAVPSQRYRSYGALLLPGRSFAAADGFCLGPRSRTEGFSLTCLVTSPTSSSTLEVLFSIAENFCASLGNSSRNVVRLLFSEGISGTWPAGVAAARNSAFGLPPLSSTKTTPVMPFSLRIALVSVLTGVSLRSLISTCTRRGSSGSIAMVFTVPTSTPRNLTGSPTDMPLTDSLKRTRYSMSSRWPDLASQT